MQVGGGPGRTGSRKSIDAGRKAGSAGVTTGTSAAAAAAKTGHQFEPKFRILPNPKEEFSPRLLSLEFAAMDPSGAPLLAPQPTGEEDLEGVDRFCSAGPNIDGPGSSKRSSLSSPADVAFPELVSRLEKQMNQASLLLNDRLRSLKGKCHTASLSQPQQAELCEISDGVAAAAYHVQKWAHALGRPDQFQRPTKPSSSERVEEAFAAVHFSLPKLMVNTTEVYRLLDAVVKTHGAKSEAHVKSLGVAADDIRAIAPHLERLLLRLGRLSTAIKPDRPLSTFIPEYFAPAIGLKLGRQLVPYIISVGL